MESFITNPGFHHLGQNILRHLNKKTLLSLRLVNHSSKYFVDNPRFWLKKLDYKNNGSKELHEAWLTLIQKVEEKDSDLKQNVAANLIKLFDDNLWGENFPLNVLSGFGDVKLVKFIIENNMVKHLGRITKNGNTFIHAAALSGHTEIIKALIGYTNNPNAPNNYGQTPFHFAAMNGHTEIILSP